MGWGGLWQASCWDLGGPAQGPSQRVSVVCLLSTSLLSSMSSPQRRERSAHGGRGPLTPATGPKGLGRELDIRVGAERLRWGGWAGCSGVAARVHVWGGGGAGLSPWHLSRGRIIQIWVPGWGCSNCCPGFQCDVVGSAGGDSSGCRYVVLDSGGRWPPPRSCREAGTGLWRERIPLALPLVPPPTPFLYVILPAGARCPLLPARRWCLAERTGK